RLPRHEPLVEPLVDLAEERLRRRSERRRERGREEGVERVPLGLLRGEAVRRHGARDALEGGEDRGARRRRQGARVEDPHLVELAFALEGEEPLAVVAQHLELELPEARDEEGGDELRRVEAREIFLYAFAAGVGDEVA